MKFDKLTEAYLKVVKEEDSVTADYSYVYLDLETGQNHKIKDENEVKEAITGLQLVESEESPIKRVWKGEYYLVLQISRSLTL